MALVEYRKCLVILMIFYGLTFVFGLLASIPMIFHVFPQSECLLFSSQIGRDKLSYGHYAGCNTVAYVFLVVVLGSIYLFVRCFILERQERHSRISKNPELIERVPTHIILVHIVVMVVTLVLTLVTTVGYVVTCNNLHDGVRAAVQNKLNANPYDTRGEEIKTRYEDDYKFHRYTNRYGNAFGSEFYTIRVSCRSILTDPEIHQKLHDTHYEQQSRYYGYWYGQDIYAYDSQYEATKTNALIESSMAGGWLCFVFWLAGLVLIIVQMIFRNKHNKDKELDRISMHSTMMGGSMYQTDGSIVGSQFRNGSLVSGRGSSFQRGGSRGSDRSVRSSRRAIDDMALSNILKPSNSAPAPVSTSYGRKDIDDMVLNQYLAQHNPPPNGQYIPSADVPQIQPPSYQSATSDPATHATSADPFMSYMQPQPQPQFNQPHYQPQPHYNNSRAVPIRQTADATYLSRDEVETEIF